MRRNERPRKHFPSLILQSVRPKMRSCASATNTSCTLSATAIRSSPVFFPPTSSPPRARTCCATIRRPKNWRPRRSGTGGFSTTPSTFKSSSRSPATRSIRSAPIADLIEAVERLLGTRDILLSQAAIWAKYAGTGDFEQTLHLDYQGNTLVVPRDDGAFRQVNMILYYSDVGPELGPTCVVPLEHTRDLSPWPPFRPRKKYPDLYRHEKALPAKAGDLLLFSMSTFHRASELTADFGARLSHHFVWRAAAYPFAGYHQWSHFGEKPELARFIERATVRQREVIGFPPPGHRYWNEQTLAGVAARYPRMDMRPYAATAESTP